MKRFTCEIGDTFGYWKIIDNTPVIKNGHTYVLVQCKCGKQELKCLSDLRNGKATGCRSCKARERSRSIKIGDKYKHWTVIDGPITSKYQSIMWKVKCDCGTERWMQGNELTDPNSSFQCQQCAQKERGTKDKIKNGGTYNFSINRLHRLQRSAKNRGYEFTLDIPYLCSLYESQKHICAITGDVIESIDDASLDRIDSSKGYVKGNVQWVTKQANLSKHVMTMPELINFCKKVLNHVNQQPSLGLTTQEGSETNSWNLNLKEEYQKCMNDFEYFKNNYIKVKEYNTNTSAEYPENISG